MCIHKSSMFFTNSARHPLNWFGQKVFMYAPICGTKKVESRCVTRTLNQEGDDKYKKCDEN